MQVPCQYISFHESCPRWISQLPSLPKSWFRYVTISTRSFYDWLLQARTSATTADWTRTLVFEYPVPGGSLLFLYVSVFRSVSFLSVFWCKKAIIGFSLRGRQKDEWKTARLYEEVCVSSLSMMGNAEGILPARGACISYLICECCTPLEERKKILRR